MYTAAAAHGSSLTISARSRFARFLRMPQCTPAAVNPFGAQTPPDTCFIDFSLCSVMVCGFRAGLLQGTPHLSGHSKNVLFSGDHSALAGANRGRFSK